MRYIILIAVILAMAATAGSAAPSYLGTFTGSIYTPNGLIEPVRTLDVSFHDTLNLFGGVDVKTGSALYGVTPNLEIGAGLVSNSDTEVTISGKYRIVEEAGNTPSVFVGVFDVGGTANILNGDPGFYILLSKDISKNNNIRGTIGAGTGVFNGFFAGVEYVYAPNLTLMAELNGGDIAGEKNLLNVGARWAALPDLRLDAAYVDFKQLAFGASYRLRLR